VQYQRVCWKNNLLGIFIFNTPMRVNINTNKQRNKIAESQKLRGSLAEFNKVVVQLFKVWFKRSARPFC